MLNKIMAQFREGSTRIFGQFKSVAQKSGVAVDAVALEGGAAQSIIDYAQQSGLDMIVMGDRGLGKLQELILGSISRKVLHPASCPVPIVK